jgi:hypothetical protein
LTLAFNEGKACDAIVRRIEARDGSSRQDVRSPELERHAAPIELTCLIGGRLYAFEHTGIEPFAGHVRLEANAETHIRPIERMLAGTIPQSEQYELHIPAKAMQGMGRRDISRVHEIIVTWVRQVAPSLPIAPLGRYITPVNRVSLPGVPFQITLHRCETGGYPGSFRVIHMVGFDLEEARSIRVQEACERKFPKLAVWKQNYGARTVLILEDNDIQLTNPQHVHEALVLAERAVPNRPDEIYLVMTCGDPWWVWCLRIGDRSYYEFNEPGERAWEIDQRTLTPLTNR